MRITPREFWLVGRPGGLSAAETEVYLDDGVWTSPTPSAHFDPLSTMRIGDLIALKSTHNQTTGLPFVNADNTASVMTILAVGEVASVDPAAGTVTVEWHRPYQARDWYFFTYVKGLARVQPADDRRLELFNFVFNAGRQDFQRYVSNPFWSHRFATNPGLSWVAFYEAFATRLLDFRQDRTELVGFYLQAGESEPLLHYLTQDKKSDNQVGPIEDLDPFTAMGAFNRSVTDANRIRIARLLGEQLGVQAPLPEDFDAVPVLNNQNSWFVRYSQKRNPDDIDRLWDVFDAGVHLADDDSADARRRFATAYDMAQHVNGVRWNLSQGLFWARPGRFVPLDNRTRAYLARHFGIAEPANGADYVALLDELRQRMTTGTTTLSSPALVSYAAYCFDPYDAPHTVEGLATWGMRLAEVIDLNADEHDYKRRTSRLLGQARHLSSTGEDWTDVFTKALRSTNTLDFRFVDDLVKSAKADPSATLAVLNTVWENPHVDSLDQFKVDLAALLGHVTPGNATALGAALLMSVDPENNAPYSPTRTRNWYALTGFPAPPAPDSPSTRYAAMLAFLDELRDAVASTTGEPVSRLEAQGMAWATTEHPIPEVWPADEQLALRTWRGARASAWLIRSTDETVMSWLADGSVSVDSARLAPVPSDADTTKVQVAVEAGYAGADSDRVAQLTNDIHTFLHDVQPGDYLLTQLSEDLIVGVVAGAADYDATAPEGVDRVRAEANWAGAVPPDADLDQLTSYLDRPGNLLNITLHASTLKGLLAAPLDPVPVAEEEAVTVPTMLTGGIPVLPDATAELAGTLHIDQVDLQELIDLLQTRQQIVFYGPPGTGKTYLAKELARHVVGADRSRAQLVQFHPSYAYEDFFEGFRPTETAAGHASFRLTSGPLRRIAAAAAASPEYPHVLVIDELNRANLAKVFGELYFLLEYRNESINLQYRPTETFRLPPNLFFIGTMNTADRSIALLDAAMRRRFSFVELHPDEKPVSGVLTRWLAEKHLDDDRAELLAALNAAIEDQDRDLRIGPSYLMRDEANTEKGLEGVWKYDIMPLLEEHYYGRSTRAELNARFGLAALRATIATTPQTTTTGEPDEPSGDNDGPDQVGPTGSPTPGDGG